MSNLQKSMLNSDGKRAGLTSVVLQCLLSYVKGMSYELIMNNLGLNPTIVGVFIDPYKISC